MTQTKKRLAIIKLAISMTDTETIQLQVLKLGLLKTDSRLREILSTLNEHNYAQAQRLIQAYIESPEESAVIQRTSQKEDPSTQDITPEEAMIERKEESVYTSQTSQPLSMKEKIQHAKEKALIEQFELFSETKTTEEDEAIEEIGDYDTYLDIAPQPKKMSTQNINYDALLNVDAEDVLPDNITLDISEESNHNYQKHEEENPFIVEEKETPTLPENDTIDDEEVENEGEIAPDTAEDISYAAISYIDQKLAHMTTQYPPIEKSPTTFASVDAWMDKIANDGYLESEVEAMLTHIDTIASNNKAEAAQLLLVTSATQSKYAQFKFARALYKGDIIQKNLSESFTLINRLAMNDNYPEAICDLGQFYENGIEVEQDKKRASELYQEAMDLGINRAVNHYNRLHKQRKGLLSLFKK